jgi:complement component 1 Q subcomponent-binding protein
LFIAPRINITFSISALSNLVAPDDAVQDFSMYGMDDLLPDTQPVGKLFKNVNNQNGTKVPEDNIAPVDGAELIDSGVAKSYPVPMNIIIEKESMEGALAFGVAADDGDIRISRISHYSKKEWTSANMTEQRYAHEASYTGPAYGNLDEDIQRLVEDYLRERGINTALAQWVPEYIDFKEQREYMKWLDGKKVIHI